MRWPLLLLALKLAAQNPDPLPPGPEADPARPPLTPITWLGDFSFLRDASKRTDPWDRLKFLPVTADGKLYFTLGFEYRSEYERIGNEGWGGAPQSRYGYWLQRVMPRADFHAGDHFRFFSEFQFDYENGRVSGPRPGIDQDPGDVHQAFVDLSSSLASNEGFTFRVGRQEIVYGTGRLVDNNEGVNVKLSFDAARFTYRKRRWTSDLFVARPVVPGVDLFGAREKHEQTFWGSYNTAPLSRRHNSWLDVYYLGLDTRSAVYEKGIAREIRHSVGVRYFRPPSEGLDYNLETAFQWGRFGEKSIRAWTVASDTGFTFNQRKFSPRLSLRADAASGDGGRDSSSLGTFNPLFPRGAYFGPKLVLIGPYNFVDVHPVLQLQLRKNVIAAADWVFLWRENRHDGVYSIGGLLLRPAISRDRFTGSQGNFEVRWALDRHLMMAFNLAGFVTGPFLKATGPSSDLLFTNIGLTYRF